MGSNTISPHKNPKVLVFVGHYLPGFKSGGILRSVENAINYLCDEFDFFVVTRNHDVGNTTPYSNVRLSQWQTVGKSRVMHLDSKLSSFSNICTTVNLTPHDVIHLNSFFDPLSIKVLFGNKTLLFMYRDIKGMRVYLNLFNNPKTLLNRIIKEDYF